MTVPMDGADGVMLQLLSNGSLYIAEVYMEDDGKYSCMIGNSGGLDQEDAYLHVERMTTRLHTLFHRRTRASYVYNECLTWYNVVLTHGSTQA